MIKIAVVGSSHKNWRPDFCEEVLEKARKVGFYLAKSGVELLSGGGNGLPWEVVNSYKKNGGVKSVGYMAAKDKVDLLARFGDVDYSVFDKIIYLPEKTFAGRIPRDFLERELDMIENTCGMILLQGGSGSLSELSFAMQFRKPFGVLNETGGVADSVGPIVNAFEYEGLEKTNVIFEEDPELLVNKIVDICSKVE